MGFWGPTVKERNRGGRIEYYGKCEECRTEYVETDKKRVTRKLEDCAKQDKKNKRKEQDDALKEKRAQEAERAEAARAAKDKKDAEERQRQRNIAFDAKKRAIKKFKELERESRGRCAFCNSTPCKGTKPRCARVKAANLESLMDFDPADPATFDPQMKDWFK